jgi:hypothetical protein
MDYEYQRIAVVIQGLEEKIADGDCPVSDRFPAW